MNKHIQYIAVGLAALAGVLTSCSDYLDNVPKGEKIPTTLTDFTELMADEYTNHREDVTQAIILLNDRYVSASYQSFYPLWRANYLWDTSVDRVKENKSDETTYYNGYAGISTANLILENVDGATDATDAQKAVARAQARFLRASRYLTLVNYYSRPYNEATAASDGGVPVITSADVDAPYTQESVQEVYDFILSDLNAAVTDLPETSENTLYANKAAGYALLARTCLNMGRYSEALEAANEALSRNDSLFDWTKYYELYQSVITQDGSYQRIPSPMDHNWCENYYFCHGSSSYSGTESQLSTWRAARFEQGDAMLACRWKERTVGADTYYQGLLSGFFNKGGLTTTEMWLVKAECLARQGDVDGAMAIVNKVRAKHILPAYYHDLTASTATEAVKAVMSVKSNALVQTIVPFMDRRRWNLDSNYAETFTKTENGEACSLAPDSYMWVMPFPQGAISNPGNGTITQNVEK
ncbi:MAG: RagB/SusD family nutrient uptake outer membrane protein [Prevotella sp.]